MGARTAAFLALGGACALVGCAAAQKEYASEPERALAGYLEAWRRQDWEEMASYAQPSWRQGRADPTGALRDWYDFKHLEHFRIGEPRPGGSALVCWTSS